MRPPLLGWACKPRLRRIDHSPGGAAGFQKTLAFENPNSEGGRSKRPLPIGFGVLALLSILMASAFPQGADAEVLKHGALRVLTTAADVNDSLVSGTSDLPVRLEGTITYSDSAKRMLFLQDSTGGIYVHTSKSVLVSVGDRVVIEGFTSSDRAKVLNDPEIHPLSNRAIPAASFQNWFNVSRIAKILFGVGLLALGVAIWAAVLRQRVANQKAWIGRSVTIARQRSRILELISINNGFEEVLEEICKSAMELLPGAECSFELESNGRTPPSTEAEAPGISPRKVLFETQLKDPGERVHGTITMFDRDGRGLQADCGEVYGLISELSALALRQSLLYQGLVHHSTHDVLTELPNRRLCEIRLDKVLNEAKESGGQMAVIYIDINRFKFVNDQYGHRIGDLYLQSISNRLRNQLRPNDMLARVGGDEFVVIAPFPEGFDRVFALTARLQGCFHDPFELDGIAVDGSASFGFARYPEHGTTAEELTRHADHAMYVAKHESHLSDEAHGVAMISANDLELAFFNYQYRLAYQPQFSADGRLTGLEALLRMDHPVHGLLTPEAFVSVAEKHPIIVDIGAWALRRAVQDAKSWQLDTGDKVMIAVNVSVRQLEEPGYARSVLGTLKQFDFPPDRLEIELVERSLMFSGEKVLDQLIHLREAGVRISLDDFGTEQSCLSILHKLPIDTIKLDRSFIRAMDNEPAVLPIVQAIVTMARALDKRVVAEAIEHTGPVSALIKMGKMDFQGYLLSRPIASHLVPAMLDEWRAGIEMPEEFHESDEHRSRQQGLFQVPRPRIA